MMVSEWRYSQEMSENKETESNEHTHTYFPNTLPFTFMLNGSRWEVSVSLLTASTRMPPPPLHYSITPLRTEEETTGLRGEEGRGGVQLGWAEFKCEQWGTPIAHSGPPWNHVGPPPPPDGLHPVFTSTVVTTPQSVLWSTLSVHDTRHNNGGGRWGEQDLFYFRVWKYLEIIWRWPTMLHVKLGGGGYPVFCVWECYCEPGNWMVAAFKAKHKKNAVFPAEIIWSLPCLNQLQLWANSLRRNTAGEGKWKGQSEEGWGWGWGGTSRESSAA